MFPNANDRLKQWEDEHKKWPAIREKGVWRFVLREALTTGVQMTIILLFVEWIGNRFSKRPEGPFYLVFLTAFVVGAFSGWRKWKSSEREYQTEEERRQRLGGSSSG